MDGNSNFSGVKIELLSSFYPKIVRASYFLCSNTIFRVLIGLLRLSSRLYESEDWSPSSIFGILFICAHGNWYAFDKTWWGYILALFVAVAAPLSEVILMR